MRYLFGYLKKKRIFINYLLADLTRLKEKNWELRESIERLQKENTNLKETIAAQDVEIAGLKGDALYGKIMVCYNAILYLGSSQEKVIVSHETHSQLFFCCYSVFMNY